ncbi:MAG: ferrochelatase [Gammaproteobacteria bacterium]
MKQTAAYRHDDPDCLGVLMVNLGTPDSPNRTDVRRYLKEFLWDPRVVEMARPIWWLVLNGIILNTRPGRSAAAYAKVWTDQGSPLLVHSRNQRAALQRSLEDRFTGPVKVALGMRYGEPSIGAALAELNTAGARRILVLPMYPQYSATTTASIFDAVTAELRTWRWLPELRFVNHYHDDHGYVAALAESVRQHWAEHGEPDRLLFSFHGIPREYFLAGDPYHCECQKTARLLAERLELPQQRYGVTFQSRLGPKEWLKPYTDETLKALPGEGVKRVDVICPGFSADCLETLEEVAMENRDIFLEAGGEAYRYIPCLNDRPEHVDALADLVASHTRGWPETAGDYRADEGERARVDRLARAQGMGAAQ